MPALKHIVLIILLFLSTFWWIQHPNMQEAKPKGEASFQRSESSQVKLYKSQLVPPRWTTCPTSKWEFLGLACGMYSLSVCKRVPDPPVCTQSYLSHSEITKMARRLEIDDLQTNHPFTPRSSSVGITLTVIMLLFFFFTFKWRTWAFPSPPVLSEPPPPAWCCS